ncbi:TetR/AcrR family transcriptional regulator [Segeticoccus rhizosphaerae]|jgi:DNA-binding transcriptional regulator YbjK|uniref:TetR/AcrR family transcriptional regulator n=1 Tax=Segeticoccus rhizosphaerae TaxID=1104777 RepID=UPI001265923B|nr:TetR/AcrR family transcriptional regulator [Segeticoccus rhizosphaerae]
MSRRTTITDAAIATLASDGMRGLTHRAVDHAAGLPEGSTSYYFRSRLALLEATVQRLVELDETEVPILPTPDLDSFAAAIAQLLHTWVTRDRQRQLARYELTLEATRRPELRQVLVRSGEMVRAALASLLAAVGVPSPDAKAHHLAALLDGLVFDQVAGAGDRTLSLPQLTMVIRAVTAAMVEVPA